MNNFTLIIPTHNRHNYLKRSIMYFENIAASVIYCDSSEVKYEGMFGNNMVYLHLPNNNFSEKILQALGIVKTDYVALCADDDFILIDALYQGIDILTQSSSHETVLGFSIAFHEKFDGQYYCVKKLPELIDLNFTPEKNTKLFFNNYQQVLWGMYNKDIVEKTFRIIKEGKFNNENFIELVLGAIACYSGGIKILENVWSVRELSAKEHWGDKHKGITRAYFDRTNRNDFKQFKIQTDKHTYNGFSKLILESYLNLTITNKCKFFIKSFLKKSILSFLFTAKKKQKRLKNVSSYEKYSGLEKFNATSNDQYYLNKIGDILKLYCE
jgi:glycosyltransferase domain-containing protein